MRACVLKCWSGTKVYSEVNISHETTTTVLWIYDGI